MNFKGFKSGTDIRGYGAEQFSDEPLYLSDEFVMAVAESFANWLGARTGKYTNEITVSIGRDSRVSGPRIMAAAITALCFRLKNRENQKKGGADKTAPQEQEEKSQ